MTSNESEIRAKVREFIGSNFLLGKSQDAIQDSGSFLDSGIVDSTGVLEIVEFVQEAWGFRVADDELVPENLDSVDNLVRFILRKRDAA